MLRDRHEADVLEARLQAAARRAQKPPGPCMKAAHPIHRFALKRQGDTP